MAIQDRNVVRTAADLERKYNLSKLLGLAGNVEYNSQTLIKVENELNNMLNSLIINLGDVLDTQSSISLWFYEGIPTTNNEPYTDWVTPADHYGDLYYDQNSGYVYKFTDLGWVLQDDINLINAMALTNVELDVTSDHERKVYFSQPTPPYSNGDWWVLEDGVLMICQISKPSGEVYEENDFIVSSLYTATIAVKVNDTLTVLKGTVLEITEDYVKYTDLSTGGSSTIAGDNITTGVIKSNNYVADTSGTKLVLSDGTIDSKNFKVSSNGSITATNANITGAITATSGSFTGNITCAGGRIASFTIDGNALYNGIGIGNPGSAGMSANLTGWAFWAGNGVFRVQHDGYVYASNIDAAGGHIGSFTLDSNFLYSGSGTGRAGMAQFGAGMAFWAGNENSGLAPFRVDHYGNLTASAADITGKITATSGSVGGWTITNSYLQNTYGGYTIRFTAEDLMARAPGDSWEYARWYDIAFDYSDKNVKKDIKYLDDEYDDFFDNLKPASFKYQDLYDKARKNKTHFGFIAQDVKENLEKNNFDDLDVIYGEKLLKMNKDELIALNTWQIQKLKKQVQSQQEQIDYLMNEIKSLKEKNI